MGAFAQAFSDFASHGVTLIPTLADRPSKPMIARPSRIGFRASCGFVDDPKFANANAAIWTGPRAKLTIVDVDSPDPAIHAEAIRQHGDTPVKAATPSGGLHLYYRHACETRRIRPHGDALPLDILGNGLAVAPPSIRPETAEKAGGVYRFLEGSPADFDRLPVIIHGSIPDPHRETVAAVRRDLGAVQAGAGRNAALFRLARIAAQDCATQADHLAAVLAANQNFPQPLPVLEAQTVAANAWRYKQAGKLIVPGRKSGLLYLDDFARCGNLPAIGLLGYLRAHHAPDHVFAIVPASVAKALGVGKAAIRSAREHLVSTGQLVLVRRGGLWGGQQVANLYRLG